MARASATVALAVLALGAGGCGRTDDRAQVRAVTTTFLAAYAAKDGGTACAQLSSDTRKALESQEQAPCAQAVTELDLGEGDVAELEVFLTNAKVDLSSGESAFLSDESEGWRLSALGCRPQPGKPADRPFDCEIEA